MTRLKRDEIGVLRGAFVVDKIVARGWITECDRVAQGRTGVVVQGAWLWRGVSVSLNRGRSINVCAGDWPGKGKA